MLVTLAWEHLSSGRYSQVGRGNGDRIVRSPTPVPPGVSRVERTTTAVICTVP